MNLDEIGPWSEISRFDRLEPGGQDDAAFPKRQLSLSLEMNCMLAQTLQPQTGLELNFLHKSLIQPS